MDLIEMNTVSVDGYTVILRKFYDEDAKPTDYDCYDEADIEAWRNNEWRYVGVTAEAVKDGVTFPASAGIWGSEDGTWADGRDIDAFDSEYVQEEIQQAIALAEEAIGSLTNR